jgi:hypothetical protein
VLVLSALHMSSICPSAGTQTQTGPQQLICTTDGAKRLHGRWSNPLARNRANLHCDDRSPRNQDNQDSQGKDTRRRRRRSKCLAPSALNLFILFVAKLAIVRKRSNVLFCILKKFLMLHQKWREDLGFTTRFTQIWLQK